MVKGGVARKLFFLSQDLYFRLSLSVTQVVKPNSCSIAYPTLPAHCPDPLNAAFRLEKLLSGVAFLWNIYLHQYAITQSESVYFISWNHTYSS